MNGNGFEAEPLTLPWADSRYSSGGFVVIKHGDDGTVARPPSAAMVYWIGAATPTNALDYDWWYTATVTD